jgi:hypothetical protein
MRAVKVSIAGTERAAARWSGSGQNSGFDWPQFDANFASFRRFVAPRNFAEISNRFLLSAT